MKSLAIQERDEIIIENIFDESWIRTYPICLHVVNIFQNDNEYPFRELKNDICMLTMVNIPSFFLSQTSER